MNSIDSLPPMLPDDASTASVSIPQRRKIFRYASKCRWNDASRPACATSSEYESFIVNSRTRSRPDLGRGSSRNLVWIWYQICGSSL
jgi:hypothetical protein